MPVLNSASMLHVPCRTLTWLQWGQGGIGVRMLTRMLTHVLRRCRVEYLGVAASQACGAWHMPAYGQPGRYGNMPIKAYSRHATTLAQQMEQLAAQACRGPAGPRSRRWRSCAEAVYATQTYATTMRNGVTYHSDVQRQRPLFHPGSKSAASPGLRRYERYPRSCPMQQQHLWLHCAYSMHRVELHMRTLCMLQAREGQVTHSEHLHCSRLQTLINSYEPVETGPTHCRIMLRRALNNLVTCAHMRLRRCKHTATLKSAV